MSEEWDIVFFVPGLPRTAGSKRAFIPKGWTRAIVTDASAASKPWKADVKLFASEHAPSSLIEGPVELNLTFYLVRPKAHFKSSGAIRDNAPIWHTVKPDALKLARAVEDSLTQVIWKDDSQIAIETLSKRYVAGLVLQPGVLVRIRRLSDSFAVG